MIRFCRYLPVVVMLAFFLMSCATAPVSDVRPGQTPELESDEAGLWMHMDKIEKKLKHSDRIETDADLNQYVRDIVAKLKPELADDLRIYIVRTPHFNASMAPNGFMQLWTGALLRCENEAQLAYIIGHEIGHYQKRHSLQQWRVMRNTSSTLAFVSLATAVAGVGFVGDVASLVAVAGVFAYSRDQEREADQIGFDLMVKAGYDPLEAVKIWQQMEKEREAARDKKQFILFATHPKAEERIETLKTLAQQLTGTSGELDGFKTPYTAATATFRPQWLRDELRKRKYNASEVVLNNLLESGADPAQMCFFQGELHRLRAEEHDLKKSVDCYAKAIAHENTPAVAHRSMGLLQWKLGQKDDAVRCFKNYLEAAPDASDLDMIKAYIDELELENE